MTEAVPTVVVSIMVVSALTHCTLLHSMCNLKAKQINMQCHLIQELILYNIELGCNAAEATKNICGVKAEGALELRY